VVHRITQAQVIACQWRSLYGQLIHISISLPDPAVQTQVARLGVSHMRRVDV
jgi:hypothetical protein